MEAPTAKTTQSSLLSFFTTDPAPSPAVVSDYEQLREARIRRNREFFQNLGIPTSPPLPPPDAQKSSSKPRAKPTRPIYDPAVPPRRSTRKRAAPVEEDDREAEQVEPEKEYVDSTVFRYSTTGSNTVRIVDSPSPISCFNSTFKLVGKALGDPRLTKIYTMDAVGLCQNRQLLAAGGYLGFISVFGTDIVENDKKLDCEKDEEDSECSKSLMSWKSSRSWVSGVSFVKEKPTLLLSSSNDGRLIIWDVAKQSTCIALPPIVGESDTIHSKGIFSMDQADGTIATASKDSSLALTRIASNGSPLVKERSISGHHSGVIRGVCFGKTKDILADGGADGLICVLDARAPKPCTVSIESDHIFGVNTVTWSPTNEFLLLSASRDPVLLLYDIRNYKQPFLKLHGHVKSSIKTCRLIYRPAFVDNGKKVATPGEGSANISIFNLENGEITSKGAVGYDANLVFCHPNEFTAESIWVAARQINQLAFRY